jgi:hypothetical protein
MWHIAVDRGYVFFFGGMVLCCGPAGIEADFWRPQKLVFGLLPVGLSIAILRKCFRLLGRAFIRRRNAVIVGCALVCAIVIADPIIYLVGSRFLANSDIFYADSDIAMTWDAGLNILGWGRAEITLPPGYTYKEESGIDSDGVPRLVEGQHGGQVHLTPL